MRRPPPALRISSHRASPTARECRQPCLLPGSSAWSLSAEHGRASSEPGLSWRSLPCPSINPPRSKWMRFWRRTPSLGITSGTSRRGVMHDSAFSSDRVDRHKGNAKTRHHGLLDRFGMVELHRHPSARHPPTPRRKPVFAAPFRRVRLDAACLVLYRAEETKRRFSDVDAGVGRSAEHRSDFGFEPVLTPSLRWR